MQVKCKNDPLKPTQPNTGRRKAIFACLNAGLLAATGTPRFPRAPRIVFFNPGESVERGTGSFWRLVSRYMAIAARNLGMQVQVIYAERDHLTMLREADALANAVDAPDYIVIVNEKMVAEQMLKTFRRSTAKVLLMHNDLSATQRGNIGNERELISNWIGTVTTDCARGSYLVMEALYRRLGRQEAHVVGITGDRNTPVSLERAQGVIDYVAQTKNGRISQMVFGDWSYADGEQKARILLSRYPDTNIIWSANDGMALGALRAVESCGASVLVGSLGGADDVISSIAQGNLTATAGGLFLIGAWAMVMLHDYHLGLDFAHYGLNQKLDYLYVLDRTNIARYNNVIFKHENSLNFATFSRVVNPGRNGYNLSLEALMGDQARSW